MSDSPRQFKDLKDQIKHVYLNIFTLEVIIVLI